MVTSQYVFASPKRWLPWIDSLKPMMTERLNMPGSRTSRNPLTLFTRAAPLYKLGGCGLGIYASLECSFLTDCSSVAKVGRSNLKFSPTSVLRFSSPSSPFPDISSQHYRHLSIASIQHCDVRIGRDHMGPKRNVPSAECEWGQVLGSRLEPSLKWWNMLQFVIW